MGRPRGGRRPLRRLRGGGENLGPRLVAQRALGLREVVAFWFAYILTRPLGASYADWLGVPQGLGGLNFGRGTVSVGLTLVIVCLVAYLSLTKVDVEREDALFSGAAPAEQTAAS
jgi:hypothetical protein